MGLYSFGSVSILGKIGKYPQASRVSVAAREAYYRTAAGSMGETGKLVIGFETNCVPDLNALLDDGEDLMAQHILQAPPSNCLADEAEDLLSVAAHVTYTWYGLV